MTTYLQVEIKSNNFHCKDIDLFVIYQNKSDFHINNLENSLEIFKKIINYG